MFARIPDAREKKGRMNDCWWATKGGDSRNEKRETETDRGGADGAAFWMMLWRREGLQGAD